MNLLLNNLPMTASMPLQRYPKTKSLSIKSPSLATADDGIHLGKLLDAGLPAA